MSTSTPNQNFTTFGQLPVELRLEIWKRAIPEPRTIRIETVSVRLIHSYVTFRATKPALLYTSQESREEALKVYTLAFKDNLVNPVYLNFKRDILAFSILFYLENFIKEFCRSWLTLDSDSEYLEERHLALITYWVPTKGLYFKVQEEKHMFLFPCLETFIYMPRIPYLSQSQKLALETELKAIWTQVLKPLRATARTPKERKFVWKEAEGIDDIGRWLR